MGDDLDRYVAERTRRDPAFAAAMADSEPAFRWSMALIKARLDAGITQSELARRLGGSAARHPTAGDSQAGNRQDAA